MEILSFTLSLQGFSGAEDKLLAFSCSFDNADRNLLAYKCCKIFNIRQGKSGCRDESTDAVDICDNAALYSFLDSDESSCLLFHHFL